jgi:phosphoglycolate phosphatase
MPQSLAGAVIAFDLDGTLVDTAPDLHRALTHMMRAEGLPPASLEDVRNFVGQGARMLIARAAGVHGVRYAPEKLDVLTGAFVDVYAQDIAALSRPYPNLVAALDQLEADGARFVVCTNKLTWLSVKLLDALGLTARFAAVVGPDLVARKKPDPDHYLRAIEAAGGDPAFSLMVGDSANDVLSAQAAGAPVAVTSFGYTDTPAHELGADAMFDDFAELPGLARGLLQAKRPAG